MQTGERVARLREETTLFQRSSVMPDREEITDIGVILPIGSQMFCRKICRGLQLELGRGQKPIIQVLLLLIGALLYSQVCRTRETSVDILISFVSQPAMSINTPCSICLSSFYQNLIFYIPESQSQYSKVKSYLST